MANIPITGATAGIGREAALGVACAIEHAATSWAVAEALATQPPAGLVMGCGASQAGAILLGNGSRRIDSSAWSLFANVVSGRSTMRSTSNRSASAVAVAALLLGGPSVAAGQEFGAVGVLNSNASTDFREDHSPQITTDGAGVWLATWSSWDSLGDTIGIDFDILVARSTDNGATWTVPAALNSNAVTDSGDDEFPQIATDAAGNWVATWTSKDSLGGTIATDDDILVARSTDNGTTWTAAAPLNSNAAVDGSDDESPQIATDAAGNWVVLWTSSDSLSGTISTDEDILVARSTDNGATWTAPAALNTNAAVDSGPDNSPQITTDGAGNWLATWQSSDTLGGTIGVDFDILVARSTDNGATWTAPAGVNDAATDPGFDDLSPQITTDGIGNWVAVWQSSNSLGETIGTDSDLLVARSTDNGATWTAPAALSPTAATSGSDFSPKITTDGAGNWATIWYSNNTLGETIGGDRDILFARSTDNGATWTAPAAVVSSAATDSGNDFNPQLTTDGAGNWVAAWDSNDTLGNVIGSDPDILVARNALCDPTGPVAPGSCFNSVGAKLQIRYPNHPGRGHLRWQWSKGSFDQSDLETPLGAVARYALCIYDTSASVPSLAASLEVAPVSGKLKNNAPRGYTYKNRAGISDGVTKMRLKPGLPDKGKMTLSARGFGLTLSEPFGATYFEQDPSVIAVLTNSEGECWYSSFDVPDNKVSDANKFKAQTK